MDWRNESGGNTRTACARKSGAKLGIETPTKKLRAFGLELSQEKMGNFYFAGAAITGGAGIRVMALSAACLEIHSTVR